MNEAVIFDNEDQLISHLSTYIENFDTMMRENRDKFAEIVKGEKNDLEMRYTIEYLLEEMTKTKLLIEGDFYDEIHKTIDKYDHEDFENFNKSTQEKYEKMEDIRDYLDEMITVMHEYMTDMEKVAKSLKSNYEQISYLSRIKFNSYYIS